MQIAKEFNPGRGSRLGTKSEYVAFLGVFIKTLIAAGWSIDDAWHAVCNDSKYLGHYLNSENAKNTFERTGSREICGFFDLANTYKILVDDEEKSGFDFFMASGSHAHFSDRNPLSTLYRSNLRATKNFYCVGWIVFE